MEDCVSDQQFMLCTLLQKEEAIAVARSYPFSPNHSFPGLVVCAHSSIEVSQEDEFVCPGYNKNHTIQIIIELVVDLIWAGHCGCIGTYNLTKWGKSQRHQAVSDAFWKSWELADKVWFDGETYSCFTLLFFLASTPEESVASTNYFK